MVGHTQSLCCSRGVGAFTLIVLFAVSLAGCVTADGQGGIRPAPGGIIDQVRDLDLSLRHSRYAEAPVRGNSSEGAQPASYYGDGTPPIIAPRSRPGPEAEVDKNSDITGAVTTGSEANSNSKGYDINFENTPIPTVAKTLLGDILGVGYAIDPRVQGTVSLASGRPVPKKDILYVLESALRVNNVALMREANGYRLVPAAEAAGSAPLDDTPGPEAGYGITVVPVQFVSAQTVTKLLDNFVAKPGMARPDPSRNLVVIQGSAADRRAALDTIRSFDADWMRGQSVGIYPVSNSTPEPVIGELEKIIDAGEGGLSQNVVKLQPIARQNAILVVTRKPELLKRVSTWIARLDRSGGAGTGVKVYRMRYGDARQVAALLNDIFLGNSGSGLDSPTNQLVPGGGAVASASARLGLSSGQQTGAASTTGTPIGSSQTSPASPASFNARYADASGGRLGQSSGTGTSPGAFDAFGNRGTPLATSMGSGASTPILANVRIAADVANNALLIYANQENYRIIERTLQQLDRPQLQVAIDATIAEVSLNDNLNYGVQFYLQSRNLGFNPDTGSVLNQPFVPTNPNPPGVVGSNAVLSTVLPGFNFLAGSSAQPSMILNALHAVTDVRVLSTPSLVVLDNQSASLQVGDQIPITTGSATVLTTNNTVVNTIDYRNTGVILRVAPRINVNGNVLLDIEQEISTVADTPTANTLTPTVSQRKVRSSIAVASGQTVLLAGLMGKTENRSRNGLPGLDQVPGLGVLFSQTHGSAQRTELIIFIRPQIIRNGTDAHRIADELRSKMIFRGGQIVEKGPELIK
jgi:general secretion pathway protein D